jgi:teichoic acid transport system permease protein
MNAAFPRAILPLTEAYTSLIDTLPSVAVLMIFKLVLVHEFGWQMLQSLLALAIGFVFSIGLGLLLACANVYFRDTTAVLPYITRLWMYASPVLYYPNAVKNLTSHDWLMSLNPLFDIINIWTGSIARLDTFPITTWLIAIVWALFTFICGVLVFLSREGEFAVRI